MSRTAELTTRPVPAALRAACIDPADTVAFQLPNWREAVVSFYGLALGGCVLVPIRTAAR